jgi:hypothetical protein
MPDITPLHPGDDIIGWFRFPTKGGLTVEVRLRKDGAWWSDLAEVTRWLDFMYPAARNATPAHGPFGRMVLELAATDFGAEPEPPPGGFKDAEPGMIY